jgi:hypothetical protein
VPRATAPRFADALEDDTDLDAKAFRYWRREHRATYSLTQAAIELVPL